MDDIRWVQRLGSYLASIATLEEVLDRCAGREPDRVELQALVKSFELAYETGWNLMKDFLEYQGQTGISGSRDAVRQAFSAGIIAEGEIWMDMVRNRNRTAHTYNEGVAREVAEAVRGRYYPVLRELRTWMEHRRDHEQN